MQFKNLIGEQRKEETNNKKIELWNGNTTIRCHCVFINKSIENLCSFPFCLIRDLICNGCWKLSVVLFKECLKISLRIINTFDIKQHTFILN